MLQVRMCSDLQQDPLELLSVKYLFLEVLIQDMNKTHILYQSPGQGTEIDISCPLQWQAQSASVTSMLYEQFWFQLKETLT